MAVLGSDLIEETRASLESGQRGEQNRLDGALTSGATSVAFKYALGGIAAGTVVSVDTERIRVWEADTGTKTATVVERGVEGTTAAAHSTLALARTNAKFDDFRVLQVINEDLADLSSPNNGLFRMRGTNITFNSGIQGYDLSGITDLIELYEIRFKKSGGSKYWPPIPSDSWRVSREMDTAEFPTGNALFLLEAAASGQPLRIRYKAHFSPFVNTTDALTAVTGLPERAKDILVYGAKARLMADREPRRGFYESQGEPRRADEVPPGTQMASARTLMAMRADRIRNEAALLAAQFPTLL